MNVKTFVRNKRCLKGFVTVNRVYFLDPSRHTITGDRIGTRTYVSADIMIYRQGKIMLSDGSIITTSAIQGYLV